MQLGDEALERHVLVCERIPHDTAHLRQQRPEARRALEVGGEHDGVREQADCVLELAAIAPDDRWLRR